MISREHYDWWYDENIKKNQMEEGWGVYAFPLTSSLKKHTFYNLLINNILYLCVT